MKDVKLLDLVRLLEDGSRFVVKAGFEIYEFEKEEFISIGERLPIILNIEGKIIERLSYMNVESFRFSTIFNLILIEVEKC